MAIRLPATVKSDLAAKLTHYRSMASWYNEHAAKLEAAMSALDVIADLDKLPLDPPSSNGSATSNKVLLETPAELSINQSPVAELTKAPDPQPEPEPARAKQSGAGFSLTGSLKSPYRKSEQTPEQIVIDVFEANPTTAYTSDDLITLLYGRKVTSAQLPAARGAVSRLLGKGLKQNLWQQSSENPTAYQALSPKP